MSRADRKSRKRMQRRDRDRHRTHEHESRVIQWKQFLRSLGVLDDLRGLVNFDRLCRHWPRMVVRRGPGLPSSPLIDQMVKRLQQVLDEATCTLSNGYSVSVQQFASSLWPVLSRLCYGRSDNVAVQEAQRKLRVAAEPVLSSEATSSLLKGLCQGLRRVLIRYGRLDSALYYVDYELRTDNRGRRQPCFTLHQQDARTEQVVVDGKPRIAYWCGQPGLGGPIQWVKWSGKTLGLPKPDQEYPVLVQRHTLDRLYGRQGRLRLLWKYEELVHDCLWRSLRSPMLCPPARDDGGFLVEYRIGPYKLGYLVGQVLSDKVVIRTFLFLTMDGTPEGEELHRQLRINRTDKAFLGLDDLATFVLTDVQKDAQLVSLLKRCGCGHLCECVETDSLLKQGYAQTMKDYLKLDQCPGGGHPTAPKPSGLSLWGIPLGIGSVASNGDRP